ncbi:MAG: efflux RND transporter periplasmic adaptor subunit [Planctomycetaceae bacterium]|nr:efflux RND transporter periplasmic adaptor subunit [Planctomycetaceae bacterium]
MASRARDILFVGLIGCVLALPQGCAKPPAIAEPPPPKVTVAHPQVRELTDYEEYNAWTAASAEVEIRSRVRGHIVKVDFVDGEIVPAGKLLFELDPSPFLAEIGRAQGQLAVAQASQEQAIKEEERYQQLYDKKAVTSQDLEQRQAARKTWDAQVATAADEIKRRNLDLEYAKITAPIGGKVGRAFLTVGDLVNAGGGDPLLTTIVSLDPIYVYFNVDSPSLIRYRRRRLASHPEQARPLEESEIPFEFAMELDEGFPHKGILDFADNRINSATGTIEIRGRADNSAGLFIPGSRCRVRVPVSDPYQGVLVPDTAILTDLDQKYLLCLNADNIVTRRDVKLGRLLDDGLRVVSPAKSDAEPLRTEDRVIVQGLQRARLNYPVEPMDEAGHIVARSE